MVLFFSGALFLGYFYCKEIIEKHSETDATYFEVPASPLPLVLMVLDIKITHYCLFELELVASPVWVIV